MRAPAISSWAEKIFFVDWVERIRRRSARREPAMSGAPLDLDGLLAALAGVQCLDVLVLTPQRLALGGGELDVEGLHRPLPAAARLLADRPRVANVIQE